MLVLSFYILPYFIHLYVYLEHKCVFHLFVFEKKSFIYFYACIKKKNPLIKIYLFTHFSKKKRKKKSGWCVYILSQFSKVSMYYVINCLRIDLTSFIDFNISFSFYVNIKKIFYYFFFGSIYILLFL